MVMVATPINAHTTNTDRPAGEAGAKSPYPVVVNAMKPIEQMNQAILNLQQVQNNAQKYNASPYVQPSVELNIADPT